MYPLGHDIVTCGHNRYLLGKLEQCLLIDVAGQNNKAINPPGHQQAQPLNFFFRIPVTADNQRHILHALKSVFNTRNISLENGLSTCWVKTPRVMD